MTETPKNVTGGCFCGAVRYEVEAFLNSAFYCHCGNCRRLYGQPVAVGVPVVPGTLRFTQGEPRYYQTSDHAKRGFCATCGSRIVYQPLRGEYQHFTQVELGSLNHPEEVRPKVHAFIESRLPWFETADELPRLEWGEMPEDLVSWSPEGRGA